MAEEKLDKESLVIKRLNVLAEMPAFREKMHSIKGGNQGFGKEIKWGNIKGTNQCFSYFEDKTPSGTKYIITSDLLPMNGIKAKTNESVVNKLKNLKIKDQSDLVAGSKIPKDVDIGLEGIEGTDDIDNWGGKKKKRAVKKKVDPKKKKVKAKKPVKKTRTRTKLLF